LPTYATREDVLRELGGDEETIKERIGLRLWTGDMTEMTVDLLEFEVPDHILARIDVRIEHASSRLNTAILAAYKGEPASPYPPHLVQATAQLAASQCCTTDGARPEYLREMVKDVDSYFSKIAAMQLDLGIEGPRESHRAPAAYVARGVGIRGRTGLDAEGCGCDE
jgi:hypothetical protein